LQYKLLLLGATVILACRDRQRTQAALEKIVETTKNQKVIFEQLDLADLSSVRSFAKRFLEKFDRLDILINNAGIAMSPYSKTKDGFESQIQTNHLGFFFRIL
jgi:retinol dehydrogenase-12